MIEGSGNAQSAVDASVELDRNAWDPSRLHEGDKLVATDIEKEMPDPSAFLDFDGICDDRLEPENAFVEFSGLVEIESGKADV
jgi:hypothetical protein